MLLMVLSLLTKCIERREIRGREWVSNSVINRGAAAQGYIGTGMSDASFDVIDTSVMSVAWIIDKRQGLGRQSC
jgi:hypothetical protein